MLVEQAREGDHDAFAVLAGAAIARLDAAARLILRDPELARDAVQDGLVRAWRNLPSLRDPDRFDAWVHRLVVNACLDTMRRKRRRALEVEITEIDAPMTGDIASLIADRDLLAWRTGERQVVSVPAKFLGPQGPRDPHRGYHLVDG